MAKKTSSPNKSLGPSLGGHPGKYTSPDKIKRIGPTPQGGKSHPSNKG